MIDAEPELSRLADRVRTLAGEQRYAEVRQALEEYGSRLRAALVGLSPGEPRALRMVEEWARLMEHTRRRVLAGRAHAARRLARLPRPLRFHEPVPRRTWELVG